MQYKTVARGMAYPFGTYNEHVIALLEQSGICYSRTVKSTENFSLPQNLLELNPTCHHNNPNLMKFAEHFVNENSRYENENWMFCVWGHSYEFDGDNNWDVIEGLAKFVSFNDDIWYATNIEIYDYILFSMTFRLSEIESSSIQITIFAFLSVKYSKLIHVSSIHN